MAARSCPPWDGGSCWLLLLLLLALLLLLLLRLLLRRRRPLRWDLAPARPAGQRFSWPPDADLTRTTSEKDVTERDQRTDSGSGGVYEGSSPGGRLSAARGGARHGPASHDVPACVRHQGDADPFVKSIITLSSTSLAQKARDQTAWYKARKG